ncbi:restriction endonuclease subunit S [Tateyamaria sp.]|uniref:restriction endonuclease subunit S n=1 Tax=Tateyamaria sp. TaxID=1929288 RepID=UPI003B20F10D
MTQTDQQNEPKLRFPGFDTAWEAKRLGDFFTFKNGVNADKSAYGKGRKFINVLDIISDTPITYNTIIGSVAISDKEFEKNEVRYGDILFQRSSETREEVGQSNVYLDQGCTATFGGFVIRGRPITEIEPKYFHNLLKTARVRKDMTARSGGSTRYNVGQESLSAVPITIAPTLNEQCKIADFVEKIAAKIAQLERKKALVEDYKKGCMQQLFSHSIRFKDEDGKDFPDWEEKRLGEVATKTASSISASSLETSPGEYPVYGASGIAGRVDYYSSDDYHIGVVKDGSGVGRLHFCPPKSSVLGTLESVKASGGNSIKFIFYWMSQINFAAYSTGSTVPHVYFKDYGKKRGRFPHPDEQRKIADFLSALDHKIDLVEHELSCARSFKKGLLQQMFV